MKPTEKQIFQLKMAMDIIYPLDDKYWLELQPLFFLRKINKNTYFSREGDLIRDLGMISEGVMRIFHLNEKGEEWNKHFLQKTDFVAAGFSPEKKSMANIQALTNVTICCIRYSDLTHIAEKYAQVNKFIQLLVSKYLEQKQQREIRLLSEEAMNNYKNFREKFSAIEKDIPQYHIASFLGITPTQLSRIKKKLDKN